MTTLTTIEIEPPYLLFIGDMDYELDAKTAFGIAHWRPELCLAQLRFGTRSGSGSARYGAEGRRGGGGQEPDRRGDPGGREPSPKPGSNRWSRPLVRGSTSWPACTPGSTNCRASAKPQPSAGVRLVDVRKPSPHIPVGMGVKRPGRRLLTVGTDCAVGKKYTALAIEKEMRARRHEGDLPRDRADGHHDCR